MSFVKHVGRALLFWCKFPGEILKETIKFIVFDTNKKLYTRFLKVKEGKLSLGLFCTSIKIISKTVFFFL